MLGHLRYTSIELGIIRDIITTKFRLCSPFRFALALNWAFKLYGLYFMPTFDIQCILGIIAYKPQSDIKITAAAASTNKPNENEKNVIFCN